MAVAGIADTGRGRLQTDGDAAAKEKQRQLPKLDSAWKKEVEDVGGAAVLATVKDDASGQRSTGAGEAEFLLGEAQVRVAVVLCCRVPWREGDEEDRALGAGQEARAAGSGTTQTLRCQQLAMQRTGRARAGDAVVVEELRCGRAVMLATGRSRGAGTKAA